MKTWFLPPDFTFKPDGFLQLGAVIAHPNRPTQALASPRTDPSIALPPVQVLVEKNHVHSDEASHNGGVGLFAKFADMASGSVDAEASRRNAHKYSKVDHEVRSLEVPFSKAFLASITDLDSVKEHMESGLLGKRPVYFVSALRVTNTPFTVTDEKGSGKKLTLEGSGAPAGTLPLEAGGSVTGGYDASTVNSYDTAEGIIFAYRLHVLRQKSSGKTQTEMFYNRSALFTGGPEGEEMEAVEVTGDVMDEDLEEAAEFDREDLDNDECCLRAST